VVLEGSPLFTRYANQADCNYQGVGGLVLGLARERLTTVTGIQAVVTRQGFSQTVQIDTDPAYGWVVKVDNKPNRLTYTIQLLSREGAQLSPPVTIRFPGTCENNLALVSFAQRRPF
jgi:hypothetical protein